MLFDWLVVGQVVPFNPAASVRGPRYTTKKGKTPVLSADEARVLLDSIKVSKTVAHDDGSEKEEPRIVGLRDRALIALMTYTFARVGAAIGMDVEDYYVQGRRWWREFRMEAEVAGQALAFSVSASEFARMGWVLQKLGPQAIVYPGQQHHARAAIQWLSGQIRQERVFAHLGWRKHGPHWVYLHAGGAMGVDGPLLGVQVQLPAALQSYQLLPSKSAAEQVSAVQASLRTRGFQPVSHGQNRRIQDLSGGTLPAAFRSSPGRQPSARQLRFDGPCTRVAGLLRQGRAAGG